MFSTKRIVLAAVFIGFGLLVSSPAGAQTLTNTGAEPGASGQAGLADVTCVGLDSTAGYSYIVFGIHSGTLTLHCEGLVPGATYRVGPVNLAQTRKAKVEPYLYVTASESGTLDLVETVSFYGSLWQWVALNPYDGYYECVAWGYPYEFSVDRKVKGKCTAVLTGCL
jgi:hypothetical protein